MPDKQIICANCGKTLAGSDAVFVCLNMWLQWNHYADISKYAGCYCSKECFAEYWLLEKTTVEDYYDEYD
jgi:hypothetical protein